MINAPSQVPSEFGWPVWHFHLITRLMTLRHKVHVPQYEDASSLTLPSIYTRNYACIDFTKVVLCLTFQGVLQL